MPVMKLGRRQIAKIPAVNRVTFYYDSDLKGFGLRVMPSGKRAWIAEYRVGAGGRKAPTRRVTLGSTELLSPEKARAAARDTLAEVRLGGDPAATRKIARQAPTIKELLDRYNRETGAGRKKSTQALYDIYWHRRILPEIGTMRVRDVTHSDIASLHRKIGEHAPPTANRVVAVLSTFFRWTCKIKERPAADNPALEIEPFPESPRERFLTTGELMRLGAAIEEAETIGIPWDPDPKKKTKHARPARTVKIDQWTAAALRLLLFTGARHREVLHAKRANVDRERGLLMLDDSKTGKKTIVLNSLALAVIEGLPDVGPYLFPGDTFDGDDPRPRTSLKRAWERIRDRAALPGVRIHDLRHTFASYGAGARMGLPIIGKLLGHAQASTTERYAHLETDPLRVASEAIAGAIAAALTKREMAR